MSRRCVGECIAAFAAASFLLTSCSEGDPEPPSGSRMITIATTGGAELAAIEAGSGGRMVVLSHGATGTKEDFFGLAGVFAKDGWTAIAYDARSAAREDDLRAVVAYARDSGATSLVLVGGSLGASLSTPMAVSSSVVVSLSAPASSFGSNGCGDRRLDPCAVAVAEDNQPYATNAVDADAPTSATIVQDGTGRDVRASSRAHGRDRRVRRRRGRSAWGRDSDHFRLVAAMLDDGCAERPALVDRELRRQREPSVS
jgi:dienelactone hydrolase